MPTLTPEEQKRLLGPMDKAYKCLKCGQVRNRKYCRECDMFYFVCACPAEPGSNNNHNGHRTY